MPGAVRIVPPVIGAQHLGGRGLLGQHGAAEGHNQGDDAVDALGALVLDGFEVAGGLLGDGDVDDRPEGQRTNIC